jgi:hypothetical protein
MMSKLQQASSCATVMSDEGKESLLIQAAEKTMRIAPNSLVLPRLLFTYCFPDIHSVSLCPSLYTLYKFLQHLRCPSRG